MLSALFLLLLPPCVFSETYHDSEKVNEKKKQWIRNVFEHYRDNVRRTYHPSNEEVSDLLDGTMVKKLMKGNNHGHLQNRSIHMPGVAPQKMDTYLCVAHKLPKEDRYIVGYNPDANMKVAHHMLLFACSEPFKEEESWDCREMAPVCGGGPQTIMYAWAKNAPALKMPDDVGFHVGGDTGYNYLVLQVHYMDVSSFKDGKTKDYTGIDVTLDDQKKSKLAGIYLLANGYKPIPPNQNIFHVDNGCTYVSGPTFKAFRFRVHAHKLGVVITAYRVRNGTWTLIGRGDPQQPQAFYRSNDLDIQPGDSLMGRCTYNSSKRDRWTHFGATHNDEMCNFYLMYSFKPEYEDQEGPEACSWPGPQLFNSFPRCSDVHQSKLITSGCTQKSELMMVP